MCYICLYRNVYAAVNDKLYVYTLEGKLLPSALSLPTNTVEFLQNNVCLYISNICIYTLAYTCTHRTYIY